MNNDKFYFTAGQQAILKRFSNSGGALSGREDAPQDVIVAAIVDGRLRVQQIGRGGQAKEIKVDSYQTIEELFNQNLKNGGELELIDGKENHKDLSVIASDLSKARSDFSLREDEFSSKVSEYRKQTARQEIFPMENGAIVFESNGEDAKTYWLKNDGRKVDMSDGARKISALRSRGVDSIIYNGVDNHIEADDILNISKELEAIKNSRMPNLDYREELLGIKARLDGVKDNDEQKLFLNDGNSLTVIETVGESVSGFVHYADGRAEEKLNEKSASKLLDSFNMSGILPDKVVKGFENFVDKINIKSAFSNVNDFVKSSLNNIGKSISDLTGIKKKADLQEVGGIDYGDQLKEFGGVEATYKRKPEMKRVEKNTL